MHDSIQQPFDSQRALTAAGELIAFTTSAAARHLELPDLRRETLEQLAGLLELSGGFWAWGHGHPFRSPVLPVAVIDFGLTDELRGMVIDMGLSAEMDKWFRKPIAACLGEKMMETTISDDIKEFTSIENVPKLYKLFERAGWTDWIHSVRYSAADCWSNMFFFRSSGKFNQQDAAILDFAMANMQWLHANTQIQIPSERLVGLTNRQQSVVALLLDGLSRKMIAKSLSLSEDTIGDHIKAIYTHFQVSSATELAAMFLRGA